jgi:hypothetical protein
MFPEASAMDGGGGSAGATDRHRKGTSVVLHLEYQIDMSPFATQKRIKQQWRRLPLIGVLLLLVWSFAIAGELAHALEGSHINTVDPVPAELQLGEELYLKNCSTCHFAVPPAVLPTQTWLQLLQDPNHYGKRIEPPIDPGRLLVWNYLQNFSRPQTADEAIPYRVGASRHFKALHPRVELPQPISLSTCVTCHPGATTYDFRSLTPEWENAN